LSRWRSSLAAEILGLRTLWPGTRDRIGLLFAYTQVACDVSDIAIGHQQDVGQERINSYGVGGYWTHFGLSDW
jgi:Autotransporter beta-domain